MAIKNSDYAEDYAREVIKGRWIEGEESNGLDPASFIINSVKAKLEAEKLERQAKLEAEERERQAKLEAEERERQAEIKRQNHIASKHNQLKEFVDKVAHLILQDGSTVGDYANKIRPNLNEDFDINEVRNQIINYAIQNYAQENEENEYSNNFEDFINAFNSVVLANCAEDADKKIKELDAYDSLKNFVNQHRWYLNEYGYWCEYQRYENHEKNNIFDGAEGFWTIEFSHGNTKTKSENAVVVLNKLLSDTKLSLENMYKDVSLKFMTTTHKDCPGYWHEDCPGYWVNVVVSYRYKK